MRRRVLLGSLPAAAACSMLAPLAAPNLARAQAATRTSVGLLRLASSAPVFIAQEKGYFREAGLDVELKIFTAAAQVPTAVVSGDAEFGVTGLTAGFFNLAGRGGPVIIAAQSRDEKGFQLSAIMATRAAYEAGLRSSADLRGKRIANTTAGSTFHYMIGRIAQVRNFPLASVTLVHLQTLPNMASAFKGGQVDAMIVPATVARPLEAEGAGRIIGWVGDEAPWQLGALFTSPRMIAERRPVIESFVRAYVRACGEYHAAFNQRDAAGNEVKGPGYDALLALVATAMQQRPEQVAGSLAYIDPQGRLDVGDVHNQVRLWQSLGLVAANVNPASTIDLGFVQGHFNLPR